MVTKRVPSAPSSLAVPVPAYNTKLHPGSLTCFPNPNPNLPGVVITKLSPTVIFCQVDALPATQPTASKHYSYSFTKNYGMTCQTWIFFTVCHFNWAMWHH